MRISLLSRFVGLSTDWTWTFFLSFVILTLSLILTDVEKTSPLWKSTRLTLALFAFFAFLLFYALRVNTGFAIVCMVNQTAIRHIDTINNNSVRTISECDADGGGSHYYKNSTIVEPLQGGELVWDKHLQGLVHGSLSWGYLLTNMAGGILATKFGGKRVIGLSLLAASLLTLFVPVVARHDVILFMALRFLTGVTQGFVSPAMQSLWSFWAPPLESSMLRSICFAGAQLGKVLTYPVTALLCDYGIDGGWPSIFYLQGAVGVFWFISWCFMVYDTPGQHPRISKQEKDYIETSLHGIMPKNLKVKSTTPWVSIFTSPRVWAIIVAHVCSNWGDYTFLTNIPTYLEEVLRFDVKENGFLSSVPYICVWIMISLSSWLADLLRQKGLMSTIMTRKLFTTIGFIIPAGLLVALGHVDCSQPLTAVVLLTLGVAFTGTHYGAGLYMNAGDIAPKYAGVVYGLSNTIATIPGFLAPFTIGILTEEQKQENWRSVFYISAGIFVFGALFFLLFASGDVQPWAYTPMEINIDVEVDDQEIVMTDTNKDEKEPLGESELIENQSDSLLESSSHRSSSNNEDSLIEVHEEDPINDEFTMNTERITDSVFSESTKDNDELENETPHV